MLLHPQIPKPLHGLNPRTILGDPWWKSKRIRVQKSTNYHCIACGIHRSKAKYHKWLECHEIYIIDYKKGTATFADVVPLCHSCHAFIHRGLLKIQLDKGEISKQKYIDIINHGIALVGTEFMVPTSTVPWNKWKLIIKGQEFYSLFRNESHWASYYGVT